MPAGSRSSRLASQPYSALSSAYAGLSSDEIDALIAQYENEDQDALGGGVRSFAGDPARYCQERLGITLWAKQLEILAACIQHQRVLVKACHAIGKTYCIAAYVLYVYECYAPSIVLTTAPTFDQVVELLWKQMRVLAATMGLPFLPSLPLLQDPSDPMHYAKGLTARTGDAFQGRHEERVVLAFDEAVGVKRDYWRAAEGMLTGDAADTSMVAIFNPTDTSSVAYENDRSTLWHSISVSALEHPNILAELRGQTPPYPKAVRLSYLDSKVKDPKWCTPLARGEKPMATDFQWPPLSNVWYRPGAEFEAKVLGRWPTRSVTSVWSDAAWDAACSRRIQEPNTMLPQIGCDVARFGDDQTVMHVRRGPCSLYHESHTGADTVETSRRLMELAGEQGRRCGADGRTLPIAVDDTGVGGGVTDALEHAGYNVVPINSMERALDPESYPNRRSELWFGTADRAMEGRLDLTRLPTEVRDDLRREVMSPRWRMDSLQRRLVEPKSETKRRLGHSPDPADGFNLAFALAAQMAIASGSPGAAQGRPPELRSYPAAREGSTPPPTGPAPDSLESDEGYEAAKGRTAVSSIAAEGADPWGSVVGAGGGDPRLALLNLLGYHPEILGGE